MQYKFWRTCCNLQTCTMAHGWSKHPGLKTLMLLLVDASEAFINVIHESPITNEPS